MIVGDHFHCEYERLLAVQPKTQLTPLERLALQNRNGKERVNYF